MLMFPRRDREHQMRAFSETKIALFKNIFRFFSEMSDTEHLNYWRTDQTKGSAFHIMGSRSITDSGIPI